MKRCAWFPVLALSLLFANDVSAGEGGSGDARLGSWKSEAKDAFLRLGEEAWLADENGRLFGGKVVELGEGKISAVHEGKAKEFAARIEDGVLVLKRDGEEVRYQRLEETPKRLAFLPFGFAEAQGVDPERVQTVGRELNRRLQEDQAVRRNPQRRKDMRKVDRENTAYLRKLTAELGWIDASRFGPRTSNAAFLIVQHSGDIPLMLAALGEMERDVREKRMSGSGFALLYDRLHLRLGGKQRYGSQVGMGPDGVPVVLPVEDPEKVDEYRLQAGLPPLKTYLSIMERIYRKKVRIPWEEEEESGEKDREGGEEPGENPLATPRASIRHQLRLLSEGDVDGLKACFTDRIRERITAETVEKGRKEAKGMTIEDLYHSERMSKWKGKKTCKVKMKNGRTLTTLVLEGDRWLADTLWFR